MTESGADQKMNVGGDDQKVLPQEGSWRLIHSETASALEGKQYEWVPNVAPVGGSALERAVSARKVAILLIGRFY